MGLINHPLPAASGESKMIPASGRPWAFHEVTADSPSRPAGNVLTRMLTETGHEPPVAGSHSCSAVCTKAGQPRIRGREDRAIRRPGG